MIRLLALAGAAAAFAPTNLGARPAVALNAEMTKSKLTSMVQELTKENFDSIYEQEAWIVANGGSSIVKKTQRRLASKARRFGLTVKPDFLAGHKILVKQKAAREAFFVRKGEQVEAEKAEVAEAAEAAKAEVAAAAEAAKEAAAAEAEAAAAAAAEPAAEEEAAPEEPAAEEEAAPEEPAAEAPAAAEEEPAAE